MWERNKVQHLWWSIVDNTIRDGTHSLTTSSHWTQHLASDCYKFVIVICLVFHVRTQKCLFHRRGRPRSFKSFRKQFFSYSFCENPNTPRAPHESLDHQEEEDCFSFYKNPNHPPLSSTWGLGPSKWFVFFQQTHLPSSGCDISLSSPCLRGQRSEYQPHTLSIIQYGVKRMELLEDRMGPGAPRRKEAGSGGVWKMEVLGRGWSEMDGIVVEENGGEMKAGDIGFTRSFWSASLAWTEKEIAHIFGF